MLIQAGEHTAGDAQGDPDNSQVLEDELDIISEDSNIKPKSTNQTKESSGSLLLGLDQAILKSIEACPTEEMKKKMYTTVLIVGSGFKFRHVEKFLTQKLALQVSQFCRKFEFHFVRYFIRLIGGHSISTWTRRGELREEGVSRKFTEGHMSKSP